MLPSLASQELAAEECSLHQALQAAAGFRVFRGCRVFGFRGLGFGGLGFRVLGFRGLGFRGLGFRVGNWAQ